MKAEDNIDFSNAVFNGIVNLEHSRFRILKLCSVELTNHGSTKPLQLDGMTYQSIEASVQPKICSKNTNDLPGLLNMTSYSKSTYANVESFYRGQGGLEEADNIFIAQKKREREEMWKEFKWSKISDWSKLPALLWNYFLDFFVGYGRRPERVLLLCIGIVILGWFVFRREDDMMLQKGDQPADEHLHRYSPIYYSLDLFLPFIDLYAAEIWIPRKDRKWHLRYMRIHAMLGWILVPVGLAALTGFIK
jgi:hypothetical protein